MTPGTSSTAFKLRDATSYDAVTSEFNSFSDRFTTRLADRVVKLAVLHPGDRVLDIGTGTGLVALAAAEAVRRAGRVEGIDLSEGMLAAARAKALEKGLCPPLNFVRMDAEALQFGANEFDAVLSLFALMHFPDPLAALKEMRRVLVPHGRLVVAVGSRPPLGSLQTWAQYFTLLPDVRDIVTGRYLRAPAYLNALIDKHIPVDSEPEETQLARKNRTRTKSVVKLIQDAGFRVDRTLWEGHRGQLDTVEEFWSLQLTYSSKARKRWSNASLAQREAIRSEFFQNCQRVKARGGRLVYPYAAYYVVAHRP